MHTCVILVMVSSWLWFRYSSSWWRLDWYKQFRAFWNLKINCIEENVTNIFFSFRYCLKNYYLHWRFFQLLLTLSLLFHIWSEIFMSRLKYQKTTWNHHYVIYFFAKFWIISFTLHLQLNTGNFFEEILFADLFSFTFGWWHFGTHFAAASHHSATTHQR